jgi:hypothetical protein
MLILTIAEGGVSSNFPDPNGPDVQRWRDYEGRLCACAFRLKGEHWIQIPGLAYFRVDREKQEVVAFRETGASDALISETFSRIVVPIALQAMGTDVLHASGVLTSTGVAAFCAISETGKSTTAFALAQRGYPHWADDAIPFKISESEVRALPLSFRIRLHLDALNYFKKNGEIELPNSETWNDATVESAPLNLIVVLKRTTNEDGPTVKAEKLLPLKAFREVLLHAHFFNLKDRELKRQMITNYTGLTARVPVWEVCFQPGFENLSRLLDQLEKIIGLPRQ